jgi:hypothetical protein
MLLNLMFSAMTASSPVGIPYATTPAAALSTRALEHDEVLRIRRDFGKPSYEIVVDTWHKAAAPDELADVRMWWVQPDRADVRSPFGSKVHKYVDLQYAPEGPGAWSVTLRADRKEFSFDVEVDDAGDARAFADVVAADGSTVRCEATEGRLIARRLLGIPLGIKRLEVTCKDAIDGSHRASLPHRKLKRGPVYQG